MRAVLTIEAQTSLWLSFVTQAAGLTARHWMDQRLADRLPGARAAELQGFYSHVSFDV
jgi:hypothetical protein